VLALGDLKSLKQKKKFQKRNFFEQILVAPGHIKPRKKTLLLWKAGETEGNLSPQYSLKRFNLFTGRLYVLLGRDAFRFQRWKIGKMVGFPFGGTKNSS
jgi:hypothetical protein